MRTESLPRNLLLARLEDDRAAPTALVLAPAGFGKSTLLGQWADRRSEQPVWLTLTSRCRDFPGFLGQLAVAFSAVDGSAASNLMELLSGESRVDVEMALDALLADVARLPKDASIVLDDFHVSNSESTSELLAGLVEHLPSHVRLVVGTREPPRIPLARFRVQRRLDVVNSDDLRFSDAESAYLLKLRLGDLVSDRVLELLLRRIDGWAAGLEMSVLALRGRAQDDFDSILERFGSSDLLVREFLFEEVLNRQSPELRSFLLQTSICEHFCHDLCLAVSERTDSASLLEEAQRDGLFVISLDPTGEWFRYHHLFSEFLQTQLQREAPDEVIAGLHIRACEWLASREMVDEAVEHALAAKNWTLASELIKAELLHWYHQDRSAYIVDWLNRYPTDLLDSDPELNYFLAFACVRIGSTEEALSRIEVAERIWEANGTTEGLAIVALVRGAVARFRLDAHESVRQAERGIRLLQEAQAGEGEEAGRIRRFRISCLAGTSNGATIVHLATGLRDLGNSHAAEEALQELHDFSVRHGFPIQVSGSMLELGSVWLQQGQLHRAQEAWTAVVEQEEGLIPSQRRLALIRLAGLYSEWGEREDAEACLVKADRLSRQTQLLTLLPELHLTWAKVDWIRGRPESAFDRLDKAVAAANALKSNRLIQLIDGTRARFWLRQGDVERASAWAAGCGLSIDQELEYPRFEEYLTLARVLMSRDQSQDAVNLLERLLTQAEAGGCFGDSLRVRIILALAYQDHFELDAAIATLVPALDLAQQSGYGRSFVAEGAPMVRLLRVALRRQVATIPIVALLELAGEESTVSRVVHQDLVEPISSREIEVLKLIAVGLTNKEIADELFISVATVKRHITNAYGKLGVSSRTEAVERSRKLQIL